MDPEQFSYMKSPSGKKHLYCPSCDAWHDFIWNRCTECGTPLVSAFAAALRRIAKVCVTFAGISVAAVILIFFLKPVYLKHKIYIDKIWPTLRKELLWSGNPAR